MQSFYRGELDPLKPSFEKKAVAWLAYELEQHLEEARAKDLREQVMAAIRGQVPHHLHTDEGEGGSFVLRRPGGGGLIEIRFGNGSEYRYKTPGIFVHWTELPSKSPEAMNIFNRRARFVRGCIQDGRDRYRGLLPADASCAQVLVSALAHDPPACRTRSRSAPGQRWTRSPPRCRPRPSRPSRTCCWPSSAGTANRPSSSVKATCSCSARRAWRTPPWNTPCASAQPDKGWWK
ncbi:MAG: hypothetical protein QM796_12645 [Chthoniobacteraceae bacterium]